MLKPTIQPTFNTKNGRISAVDWREWHSTTPVIRPPHEGDVMCVSLTLWEQAYKQYDLMEVIYIGGAAWVVYDIDIPQKLVTLLYCTHEPQQLGAAVEWLKTVVKAHIGALVDIIVEYMPRAIK